MKLSKYFILLVCFVLVACTENLFSTTADKTSDEAKMYAAQMYLDEANWDKAIESIGSLSSTAQATRDAKEILISAYSAKCGFNFINFIQSLGSMGSAKLFAFLLNAFPDAELVNNTACVNAETQLKALVAAHTATAIDHLKFVLLGMAKIGSILNYKLANASNTFNNAKDPCSAGDITNAEVDQLVTGFALIVTHIAEAALDGFDATSMTTICTTLVSYGLTDICAMTSTASVTSGARCAMRSLMNESSAIGLAKCTGDVSTCVCTC